VKSGRGENFHTTKFISLLLDEDVCNNEQFSELANSFYNTLLLYLEQRNNSVLPLDMFHWTLLKNPPTWEKILHGTKHIDDVDKNIMKILDEDEHFDKFIHNANISKTKIDE
jgi:dynactin complex subunit